MKLIKKSDIIFISFVCFVIIIGSFIFYKNLYTSSNRVVIEINSGEIFGIYSLDKYTEININDTNMLKIDETGVYMIDSNCPDQTCLTYAPITSNIQTIICLPNEIVVYLEGDIYSEIDVIS